MSLLSGMTRGLRVHVMLSVGKCVRVYVFWKWVRMSLFSGMTRGLRVRVMLSVGECVRVCVFFGSG
jgi:hypothetical protein